MIEFLEAVNNITWPAAFAIGCACFSVAVVGYAIFKQHPYNAR